MMKWIPKIVAYVVLPLLILGGAIGGAILLSGLQEEPKQSESSERGLAVETIEVERREHSLDVTAAGTVVPARELRLNPQVSGRLTWMYESLDPGTFVEEGQTLFRIEEDDYRLRLREARANLARAQAQLELEKGQRDIAKKEWEAFKDEVPGEATNSSLALREPQLASAKSQVDTARAAVDRAELNLRRTTVRAPFDGVIIESNAEIDQLVGTQTQVVRLVGTEKVRVQVSLPVERLGDIDIPGVNAEKGSTVVVRQDLGSRTVEREGEVTRLLGGLVPTGRMAQLLIDVPDPYGLERTGEDDLRPFPVLLDAYVDVRIVGQKARELIAVPRKAIREGERAFVFDPKSNELDIRELDVVWRYPDRVLVDEALTDGEQLVVSPISAPLEGMKLRRLGSDSPAESDRAASTDEDEATTEADADASKPSSDASEEAGDE